MCEYKLEPGNGFSFILFKRILKIAKSEENNNNY